MRAIKLTQGFQALVDDTDFQLVAVHSWCPLEGNTKRYAQANIKIGGQWKRVLMHRFILGVFDPEVFVDHQNGNGLDNQRFNLRRATRSQNQWNSGPRSGKYKGVTFHRKSGKFLAQIMAHNKYSYLGLFNTEEEAARAYDKEAIDVHQGFGYLNFPGDLNGKLETCLA